MKKAPTEDEKLSAHCMRQLRITVPLPMNEIKINNPKIATHPFGWVWIVHEHGTAPSEIETAYGTPGPFTTALRDTLLHKFDPRGDNAIMGAKVRALIAEVPTVMNAYYHRYIRSNADDAFEAIRQALRSARASHF